MSFGNYVCRMDTTPSLRLATVLLGEPVGDWVIRRRRAGASWPAIAEALGLATNGQVALSAQYLRVTYMAAAGASDGQPNGTAA